jgi:hypothetical protein
MVQLRLLPAEMGGRRGPIFNDYRPSWDLKNTWHGEPTINDGRVILDGNAELARGADGPAIIEPLAEEFWGAVDVGAVLPMQEGPRIVGYATVLEVTRPDYLPREVAAFVAEAHQFCDFVERGRRSNLPSGYVVRAVDCLPSMRPGARCHMLSLSPRRELTPAKTQRGRRTGKASTSSRPTGRYSTRTLRRLPWSDRSLMISSTCTSTFDVGSISGSRRRSVAPRLGSGGSTSTRTGVTTPLMRSARCITPAATCRGANEQRLGSSWSSMLKYN